MWGFSFGVGWAVVVVAVMTRICLAAEPRSYCQGKTCGANGVEVQYPFRLYADAADDSCYTNYTDLEFLCINKTLYLNFSSNAEYMYLVNNINYTNRVLEISPYGSANCRPFDPANFGNLNMTPSSTLLLDCKTNITSSCLPLVASESNSCSSAAGANLDLGAPRYSCPFTLADYNTLSYKNICHLFNHSPEVPSPSANISYLLELQFQGVRNVSSSSSPAPAPVAGVRKSSESSWSPTDTKVILGVVLGIFSAVILFLLVTLCWCRRSRDIAYNLQKFEGEEAFEKIRSKGSGHVTQLFSYKELEHATQGFSTKQELGGGGFGTVYRGKLGDGRLVAVKKLNQGGSQGIQQFLNEVEVLSKVRHPHLVRLLGCCMERPLLVYEFVPNGSISMHLHGGSEGAFPWETRLEVATQTAEALTYLHFLVDPPIFHRDVKTTNILLDKDFKVKVADFGLSRLVPDMDMTHISTAPQGTPGYLDPDYHESYHLSDKSDVYSFGVVLMELVTAKKAVDMARERKEINLASLAVAKIHSGCLLEIIDPHLKSLFSTNPKMQVMVEQVAELAFRCLAPEKDDRPTMKVVLVELQRIQSVGSEDLLSTAKMDTKPSFDSNDTKSSIKQDVLWPTSPTSVQDVWVSNTTSPADSLAEMA